MVEIRFVTYARTIWTLTSKSVMAEQHLRKTGVSVTVMTTRTPTILTLVHVEEVSTKIMTPPSCTLTLN